MQGLVGLDLRASRGATMSRARFEEALGPEARPCYEAESVNKKKRACDALR